MGRRVSALAVDWANPCQKLRIGNRNPVQLDPPALLIFKESDNSGPRTLDPCLLSRASAQSPSHFLFMFINQWIEERRFRAVWGDPHKAHLTLLSFAETEDDGGRDLLVAARRIHDEEILVHMRRHAADEIRHADMFRTRASEVAEAHGEHLGMKDEERGRAFNLGHQRSGETTNAHGFFQSGLFDEMGEVGYIAMLFVAETRAAALFETHRRAALSVGDTATAEVFSAILRDEKYHAAWTESTLQRWRKQGRAVEVDRELSAAKRGRFMSAWRRQGLRSASGLISLLLTICFWTVLAPFGLLARLVRPQPAGWQAPRQGSSSTSQF